MFDIYYPIKCNIKGLYALTRGLILNKGFDSRPRVKTRASVQGFGQNSGRLGQFQVKKTSFYSKFYIFNFQFVYFEKSKSTYYRLFIERLIVGSVFSVSDFFEIVVVVDAVGRRGVRRFRRRIVAEAVA